jgi:1-acyl-sn-glycerol-3-phosphate acyltransferase
VTPTGLPFPLPVKYHLHFGAPMRFSGAPDDEDAGLERKVKEVKAVIQAMLNQGLDERAGIFI